MFHSANGSDSSHSMRLLEVCRVYDMGMGVSNRRCAAEAACTISADANQWFHSQFISGLGCRQAKEMLARVS